MQAVLNRYWQQQRSAPEALASRLRWLAPLFLGKSYQWEALGEGYRGRYSQEPLYRFDAFDCVTFVNTILALLHSKNLFSFKKNLKQIRYAEGQTDYRQRTDWFTDLEWNPRAQQLGWLQDITANFKDSNDQPLFSLAKTLIDKPGWYAARSLEDLHLKRPRTLKGKLARLRALQAEGSAFVPKESQLPYIPWHACFDTHHQAIAQFWAQMPDIAVLEIVRPDWPIKTDWVDPQGRARGYGTNLNISHLGFIIKEKNKPFSFYHATRAKPQQVVVVDLFDYLKTFLQAPDIKGIHIEALLE